MIDLEAREKRERLSVVFSIWSFTLLFEKRKIESHLIK